MPPVPDSGQSRRQTILHFPVNTRVLHLIAAVNKKESFMTRL